MKRKIKSKASSSRTALITVQNKIKKGGGGADLLNYTQLSGLRFLESV
jgi:hypothetical protein